MRDDIDDVLVDTHGSVWTFEAISEAAKQWFKENVQSESWQWLGDKLGVDHRYASSLLEGIRAAGFSIGEG